MRTADRQLGLRSAYFVLCFAYNAVLLRNTPTAVGTCPRQPSGRLQYDHKAGANPQRFLEGDHIFFVRTFKISSPNPEQFPDQTMLRRVLPLLLAECCAALLAPAAMAQYSNLDTVEGPSAGEETTLMVAPHSLTEDVSGRALGVESPNDTRFALTLIGVPPKDSIDLTLAGEASPSRRSAGPPRTRSDRPGCTFRRRRSSCLLIGRGFASTSGARRPPSPIRCGRRCGRSSKRSCDARLDPRSGDSRPGAL